MKKFFRIVLVLAILVGLWFLARYAAGTGPARRHFADNLAETLGADAVAVESTTLEFPFTFVARGVKATVTAPEATVFEAPEIRVHCCCSWRVESPKVLAVAKPDGGIVPVFFGPEPVRKALDGSGRPCPVTMLSSVSDAWELPCGEYFSIRKADVAYRDLDGGIHPVFTGLTWTKNGVRLGKRGRVDYSTAKWTTFGPAVAPDGRPNDGRPGEAEWLGGRGTPIQPLWAPPPPCAGPQESAATDSEAEPPSVPPAEDSDAEPPSVAAPAPAPSLNPLAPNPPPAPAPAPAPTPDPAPAQPEPAAAPEAQP